MAESINGSFPKSKCIISGCALKNNTYDISQEFCDLTIFNTIYDTTHFNNEDMVTVIK